MIKILLIKLFFICFFFTSCQKEDVVNVDITKKVDIEPSFSSKQKTIKIAVGGMVTPSSGYAYYRKMLDYIGKRIDDHIDFIDKKSYKEINNLIKNEKVDIAFVCGGPYVEGHKEFKMELLVAPQVKGESVYYSYIIVNKNSGINSFEELRNKTFAFTDPMSNSGKLVPTYMLAKKGESIGGYFKKYVYTKSHDNSIKAVADRLVDGAAVDSLIWEYENEKSPKHTMKTRVILKIGPYGIPPVVVRHKLDKLTKEKLKNAFLTMHENEEGREILKTMNIDKFVLIKDSDYDSIREMQAWIDRKAGK